MRPRTIKLWRLHEDGPKLIAGFATYRGSFVGPEPDLESAAYALAA